MNERLKGLLMLLLLFGVLLCGAGISGLISRTAKYDAPIYLSQTLRLEHRYDSMYFVLGEFSNRTNKDVIITEVKFHLSGNDFYANKSLTNITVPANGKYTLDNAIFSQTLKVLDSVYIVNCEIDGKKWNLKYSSDGKTFESSPNDWSTSNLFLTIGSILLVISGFIIISYFVKKKEIKY